MDPRDKEMLRQTRELAEENNELLKKMYSSMKWGRILRVVYWVIVIGSAFGAYYLIQPYINTMLGIVGGLPDAATNTAQGIDRVLEAERGLKNITNFLKN